MPVRACPRTLAVAVAAALAPLTACDGQEPARAGATPRRPPSRAAPTTSTCGAWPRASTGRPGRRRTRGRRRALGPRAAGPGRARPRRAARRRAGPAPARADRHRAGLLGIAFHPDFATNRLLYLHWSDRAGDTRVAEHRARADRRTIAPQPVRELLHVRQPEENHNGGQLAFGPDGRLYLGLGDGGGAFDLRRTAQDPRSLLGKLLAVDVDRGEPRWEVVLTGVRNPWRFSFDNALGEVWVADVGQDDMEEVNRVLPEPDEPPKNLGWSVFEGTRRLKGHRREGPGELVFPAATYTHADGCSVTGGVVYVGAALPRLSRRYVYGDFCSGMLWSLRAAPGKGATDVRREAARIPQLSARPRRRRRHRPGLGGRRGLSRSARRLLSQRAHGAVDPYRTRSPARHEPPPSRRLRRRRPLASSSSTS